MSGNNLSHVQNHSRKAKGKGIFFWNPDCQTIDQRTMIDAAVLVLIAVLFWFVTESLLVTSLITAAVAAVWVIHFAVNYRRWNRRARLLSDGTPAIGRLSRFLASGLLIGYSPGYLFGQYLLRTASGSFALVVVITAASAATGLLIGSGIYYFRKRRLESTDS
jgi:hypothetical protein